MRHSMNDWTRVRLAMALAAVFVSCNTSDSLVAPQPNTTSTQFWAVTLNDHALTMSTVAPYDTLRLIATSSDVNGNLAQGLAMPIYTSSDIKDVQVDSTGLVHALGSASMVVVTVTVSNGTYSLADTAYVNVTNVAPPSPLASLSIQPVPPDSAEESSDMIRQLPLIALDSAGDTLPGLLAYYHSLDPATATVDPTAGLISGVYPGRVRLTASATVYGVTKSDTVQYVIGWPLQDFIIIVRGILVGSKVVEGFSPGVVRLSPGAWVAWSNPSGNAPIDIVFDDSTTADSALGTFWCSPDFAAYPWLCAAGNIAPFANDSTKLGSGLRVRAFSTVGSHRYHSALYGTTGEIDIVDWHSIQ
jgi:hypothetical protein